jgi:hypothetical protein
VLRVGLVLRSAEIYPVFSDVASANLQAIIICRVCTTRNENERVFSGF